MFLIRREDGSYTTIAYLTSVQINELLRMGRDVLQFDSNLYHYKKYTVHGLEIVVSTPIPRQGGPIFPEEEDPLAKRLRDEEAGGSAVDDLGPPRSV